MVRGKMVEKRASVRDSYLEMIRIFPLRPIRNNRELDQAIGIVDALLDREALDRGESDYLEVLGDLISRHEAAQQFNDDPSDAELLAHLLEARGLTQAAAARQTRIAGSTFSEVLSGKRKLTREQIEKLALFFNVAPAAFYKSAACAIAA